ncbi:MAG: hypothetical protein LLF94_09040 [Chlamydiales bacterium]|nr:hypothetical protein [Chlamydiales bacterium]
MEPTKASPTLYFPPSTDDTAEVVRQMAAFSVEALPPTAGSLRLAPFGDAFSLKTRAADCISKQVLSLVDEEWTYNLGKSSSSELLHVHIMKHILEHGFRKWFKYDGLGIARMLRSFLIGRFECLQEIQPEQVVALMTPEIEMLLDPKLLENPSMRPGSWLYARDCWANQFTFELCRGLPNCLIPAIIKTSHGSKIYSILLIAARKDDDAERLSLLLALAKPLYLHMFAFVEYINPERKETALACVRALLGNKDLAPASIPQALQDDHLYKADHLDACREIRQLLLDDTRTTSQMITGAFLQRAHRCQEVLERQLLTHPKANIQDLLIKATDCTYSAKPFFAPVWKLLMKDPRLSADMIRAALYRAVQQNKYANLPLLLRDHRIGFGTILNALVTTPEDNYRSSEKYANCQRTQAAIKAELINRYVLPMLLAIGYIAL